MRRKYGLPELLSPAGDMSALTAAISAGADAIYVGGRRFGARAYAKNFDIDELSAAVRLCHAAGVRLYVTVNTLIHEREMDEALEYAARLHAMGVDAIIACDMGFIRRVRCQLPDLELHASTQMGIHNSAGADFAHSLGMCRVVLARECSARDIEEMVEKCKPEVEVFVHGALCVCHSGQCLFSSMVGGRSGNRGECAQPCRLPFGGNKYPLSLTDLSLARHIPALISSGVASLKIEGRMKSAEYVYTVTGIFRRLLDEGRGATDAEMKELERAFSRGGFTDGYYTGKIARGMTGVRSEEDKSASRALKAEIPSIEKMRLTARATIRRGAPSELTLSCIPCSRWGGLVGESLVASVLGDIPSEAINAPLDNASVAQRLAKMGATPFVLTPDDIEIELDGGLNLSPSALNSLRRAAAQALEDKLARPIRELCGESADKAAQDTVVSDNSSDAPLAGGFGDSLAVFYEPSVLMGLVKARSVHIRRLKRVFVPLARLPELYPDCARDIAELGSELGVMMPEVVMEHELRATVNMLKDASKSGVMTTLVCNIGQIELCKCLGFNLVGDLRLNVYNPDSRAAYISVGVDEISLSPELTLPQARDVGGYALVSGRAPLMITERCFIKESFGCDKCGKAALTDRRGARFPILRTADHRNLIFNSAPTYMGDKREELRRVGSIGEYFIFSIESLDEAQNILSSYFGGKPIGGQVRRMGKRPVE